MSGAFEPGQLVTPEPWLVDGCDLCNMASVDDPLRVVGRLENGGIGLIITVLLGGINVYVLGPHGAGWTFGAYLDVVR